MKIQCTNKKTFELTDGSEKLGQIIYESLFSFGAQAVIGNDHYHIAPKGIFSTTISVTKNESEVVNMQMNWKGNITISFLNGQEYLLKAAGTFQNKYHLEDKNHKKLLVLDPDFNWAKFSYNYTISFDNRPENLLLVLLAAYAANYYISAISSAI